MAVPITTARELKGISKELRRLLTAVLAADGWRLVARPGGHFQAFPPAPRSGGRPGARRGEIITISRTGSDSRAIGNARADLRRAGLEI